MFGLKAGRKWFLIKKKTLSSCLHMQHVSSCKKVKQPKSRKKPPLFLHLLCSSVLHEEHLQSHLLVEPHHHVCDPASPHLLHGSHEHHPGVLDRRRPQHRYLFLLIGARVKPRLLLSHVKEPVGVVSPRCLLLTSHSSALLSSC